ncbi:MAG: Inner membrane protein YbaN [Stenotrophomonas maltophilia]|nr:MAG: Inner membrane protein YbaN [Stenotrophomonas maltophilia]
MPSNRQPRSRLVRLLYAALAYTSLGIGLIALVIPGLPTTEFILLSAWAAAKSSPRLSAWLENHRLFGPILHNWHNGRAIARRAKISASVAMFVALLIMLWTLPHGYWLYAVVIGMALGNLWMWSRPERATGEQPPAS